MASEKLNSLIQNLTVTSLPTDNSGIVVAQPRDYELTDRLRLLIKRAQPDISQKAAPDACPEALSTTVPRSLLEQIVDLFNRNLFACYEETSQLVASSKGYLSDTSNQFIDVPRAFWKQVLRTLDELEQKEKDVNLNSSVIRAISMPISNDCQVVANDDLLVSNLNRESDQWMDEPFVTANPNYIQNQPDSKEILNEVLDQNPQTIGVTGSTPPTNLLSIESGEGSESIPTVDSQPGSLVADAAQGALSLFSNEFLNTPIDRIKELGGNVRKFDYAHWQDAAVVTVPVVAGTPPTMPAEYAPASFGLVQAKYWVNESVDLTDSGIDFSRGLIEQDWEVTAPAALPESLVALNSYGLKGTTVRGHTIFSIYDFANNPALTSDVVTALKKDSLVLTGVVSGKKYTVEQASVLGDGLKKLWGKIKSIKLPTAEQVTMATNLAAAGLGAVGQLTGSAGLVKASDVLACISEGFGALKPELPKASPYDVKGNGKDIAKGVVFYHGNSLIPNLIRAGYEQFGKEVMGSGVLRQKLASENRAVLQAFVETPDPSKPTLGKYANMSRRRRFLR